VAEFLTAAATLVLAMTGLGLARVLWGPSAADRMMAAQLLGTGGAATALLLAMATGNTALVDIALTRLHALTKADNLGLGLIVLGLLPQSPSIQGGLKLLAVWLLVLLAGASSSQLIAQFVRRDKPGP
jgi:multicomponent Na+:H+ antiporter subunit G